MAYSRSKRGIALGGGGVQYTCLVGCRLPPLDGYVSSFNNRCLWPLILEQLLSESGERLCTNHPSNKPTALNLKLLFILRLIISTGNGKVFQSMLWTFICWCLVFERIGNKYSLLLYFKLNLTLPTRHLMK